MLIVHLCIGAAAIPVIFDISDIRARSMVCRPIFFFMTTWSGNMCLPCICAGAARISVQMGACICARGRAGGRAGERAGGQVGGRVSGFKLASMQ